MIMKDRSSTRINVSAITSYSADKDVNYATSTSWPTIRVTIGSVLLVLNYNAVEDRDSDINELDQLLGDFK